MTIKIGEEYCRQVHLSFNQPEPSSTSRNTHGHLRTLELFALPSPTTVLSSLSIYSTGMQRFLYTKHLISIIHPLLTTR